MVRKAIVSLVASAFLFGASVAVCVSADNKGPAEITLGASGTKPAQFPHKAHQDKLKCAECHHGKTADGKQEPYKEGQEIKKCDTCHNATVLAGKTKGALKLDEMKGAGHGNCLECHKETAKNDASKAALAKCETCHPKK